MLKNSGVKSVWKVRTHVLFAQVNCVAYERCYLYCKFTLHCTEVSVSCRSIKNKRAKLINFPFSRVLDEHRKIRVYPETN